MAGWGHSSTRLFLTPTLIASLIGGLLCGMARGEDRGVGKSFRVRAAAFAPIGKFYSVGEISINGRRVYGEQMIFGGELLQVSDDSRACVLLDSIGQVTLARGAIAKLATTVTNLDGNRKHCLLVATLTSGDIVVKLEQDAGAYIETCGLVFISSFGASFRIEIREGQPMIDTTSGVVRMEPQGGQTVVKPRDVQARPLKMKPKKSVRDQIEWVKSRLGNTTSRVVSSADPFTLIHNQTTQTEEPVADRNVRFEVVDLNGAPSKLGTILATTKTDRGGVIPYTFVAGKKQGSGQVRAEIDPDTNQDPPDTEYRTYVRGFRIKTFWTTRNKLLIAAAAVGGVVCVFACGPKTKPLRQEPPPIIP